MNARVKACIPAAIALAVQCGAALWLVGRYENVVRNGTEITLPCRGFDPYDALRGRYLRVSAVQDCDVFDPPLPGKSGEKDAADLLSELNYGSEIPPYRYAKFVPAEGGLWRVEKLADAAGPDGVWMKLGRVRFNYRLDWSDMKKDEKYEDFEKRRRESGVKAEVRMPEYFFLSERLADDADKILAQALMQSGGRPARRCTATYRILDDKAVMTRIQIDGRDILELAREKGCAAK